MRMLKTFIKTLPRSPLHNSDDSEAKLGLIAGRGDLPLKIIDAALAKKLQVFVLCIYGQTPQDISVPDGVFIHWVSIGEIGSALSFFHSSKVKRIVMAGHMTRPSLSEIKPDFKGAMWLAKIGMKALGDDGLLRAIASLIEGEGFQIVSSQDIVESILVEERIYTKVVPDDIAKSDIERGIDVLKAMSPVDVGQAVVVQQGIVLGVEAIEGTDKLIERIGGLIRGGALPVLVKFSKVGQESRVDLPTVGLKTLINARNSGIRGIALEAHKTIMLDESAMIEFADKNDMFIIGMVSR